MYPRRFTILQRYGERDFLRMDAIALEASELDPNVRDYDHDPSLTL